MDQKDSIIFDNQKNKLVKSDPANPKNVHIRAGTRPHRRMIKSGVNFTCNNINPNILTHEMSLTGQYLDTQAHD